MENFTYLDNSNIQQYTNINHQKGGPWENIHLNEKRTDTFRQNLID